MKKIGWLILSAIWTTGLLAQQPTTPPAAAPVPAPGTVAPSPTTKPAAKKKAAAKKPTLAEEVRSTLLVPGAATVIASNVNVRGRSGLIGEVITRINKGDSVTVIEEITLKRSKEDEPSAWAKIALPAGANVWVNTSFLDAASKTVKPKKLNLRGGPGENYSVIGTVEKGATVKEISVKGDWMEIEAPAGAFAFVAAQYLKQEPPTVAEATPKPAEPAPTPTAVPEPAPTPTTVAEPAPVATTTIETPVPAPAVTIPVPAPTATLPEPPAPEPVVEEPPPLRIVDHEGIVKGARSIQAPTKFELVHPVTGKTINYLFTTSTNLDLRRYKGMRIVVTGEEGIEERWRNTPVITIQRIVVVE